MASIISPPTTTHKLPFHIAPSKGFSNSASPYRFAESSLCRCANSSGSQSPAGWRWETVMNGAVHSVMKSINSLFNPPHKKGKITSKETRIEDEDEWDWDRWLQHFVEVDDRERFLSFLKSRLGYAVLREDYVDAAKLKEAIYAAKRNDTVGEVISHLNNAIAQERFQEAAFLCDNAGAGLVGWWSGVSQDARDPFGVIIKITAEHGRYVARRFNPRQLSSTSSGIPLFEIYLTVNKKGEYKQQAVYLKRKSSHGSGKGSSSHSGGKSKSDVIIDGAADTSDAEDGGDAAELIPGFQNMLQDVVPGFKVKVVKVTAPAKTDKDFISNFIEEIMDEEEEDEGKLDSSDADDDDDDKSMDDTSDNDEHSSDSGIVYSDEHSEISVDVVVRDVDERTSYLADESLRVPAKLVRRGRKQFSFTVERDASVKPPSADMRTKVHSQRSVEHFMNDLSKLLGNDKIPLKVLKDVSELIVLTLNQVQVRHSLWGTTDFHRIQTSNSPDPLSGLYLGANGLYSADVISVQRKYGQWHDENGSKEPSNLEFYEYVEAVKLTGDPYVPAGQVAFRAKVGKQYQLPHKGIIPEELGVVARYKGQGRISEAGFRNPKWVDGELIILDGKYIKGGPAVGFVYWAPEYHFFLFFNRLLLQ